MSAALFGAGILFAAPRCLGALTFDATSVVSNGDLILNVGGATSYVGIGNTDPQALLHVGTAGNRAGIIKLDGGTSGTITILPSAVAGTWALTPPPNDGTTGQVLTTDGNGVSSWTTIAGGGITNGAGAGNTHPAERQQPVLGGVWQ